MANPALYRGAEIDSLRWRGADVTPNNDADLAELGAAIVTLTDGTIRVTTSGGTTHTLFASAGSALPVLVDRVHATGTTATGIVALYGA